MLTVDDTQCLSKGSCFPITASFFKKKHCVPKTVCHFKDDRCLKFTTGYAHNTKSQTDCCAQCYHQEMYKNLTVHGLFLHIFNFREKVGLSVLFFPL